LTAIPAFDHIHVIAGQGTAAKELIEDVGQLTTCWCPAAAADCSRDAAIMRRIIPIPGIKVVGVEPAAGDDVKRSFQTKILQSVHNPDTIADGARTSSAGKLTFPLILNCVHDMLTVTDEELLQAMVCLWERMKSVVEPTGALGAAALFEGKIAARGLRVGVILRGGNVDLKLIAELVR
jgi:threonine dehydratase